MKDGPARRAVLQSLLAGGMAPLAAQAPEAVPAATGNDIGTLYPELMKAAPREFPLSFLTGRAAFDARRRAIRAKVFDLFHYAPPPEPPRPEVVRRWEFDDYTQEHVVFSTAPWFRVPAYVLTPKKFKGPRPGIVDLHSHGGMFVFGREKVMPMPEGDHPAIVEYRERNYEGLSTSAELCRRGYVVVSIDAFYFGERRTLFDDTPTELRRDRALLSADEVRTLNRRASAGEAALVRSLFWAGATWQGIVHWDDIRTVDYLISRPEVDPKRIACLGISMGGDRTDYLAGLDPRIQCAVSVGWMSTLRPMVRAHVNTHSFVHFLPGMARYLDLPDLLGCLAPKPLLAQYCSRDRLYPLAGMEESDRKLAAIYARAGAPKNYEGRFYDVPHIFSRKMQSDAFDWLDARLNP